MTDELTTALHDFIERLGAADWKAREQIKEELLAFARAQSSSQLVEYLENSRKDLNLELRWEIDEVLEALAPEPEPEPAEEEDAAAEEPEGPPGQISMSDLKQVYHDPRGLSLFTDKTGKRWFATQVNPYTGQPQTFELQQAEVDQLKTQLSGSPYWLLGSGAAL